MKIKVAVVLFIQVSGLFILGAKAEAMQFECISKGSNSNLYRVRGNLESEGRILNAVSVGTYNEPLNIESNILSHLDSISPDLNFRPTSEKLRGYNKYVLEKEGRDAFFLFIGSNQLNTNRFTSYLKFSFEGTFPKLEELNCWY